MSVQRSAVRQYCAVQYSVVLYIDAVQCSMTVECSMTVQISAVQCSAVQCSAVLQCSAVRIVIVHILRQVEADVNNSDSLLSRLPHFNKC